MHFSSFLWDWVLNFCHLYPKKSTSLHVVKLGSLINVLIYVKVTCSFVGEWCVNLCWELPRLSLPSLTPPLPVFPRFPVPSLPVSALSAERSSVWGYERAIFYLRHTVDFTTAQPPRPGDVPGDAPYSAGSTLLLRPWKGRLLCHNWCACVR